MVWFEEAIPLFTAVKFDGKNLPSKEFFEAALNCRKIYQYVWGGGMICRQLEKDLDVSVRCNVLCWTCRVLRVPVCVYVEVWSVGSERVNKCKPKRMFPVFEFSTLA